jgi:hypothetical protein
MIDFISGAITTAYLVSALYFLKFFRRTGDALFAWFAAAFLVFAIQRFALFVVGNGDETDAIIYGVRLIAFLMILFAIVQKNLKSR